MIQLARENVFKYLSALNNCFNNPEYKDDSEFPTHFKQFETDWAPKKLSKLIHYPEELLLYKHIYYEFKILFIYYLSTGHQINTPHIQFIIVIFIIIIICDLAILDFNIIH